MCLMLVIGHAAAVVTADLWCAETDADLATAHTAGTMVGQPVNPPGYQDAVDEARIAVEQIVIPRQQPIELLPRTQQLLEIQVM